MALTQGLWSGTGAALASVGKEGMQQESNSSEVGVQRAGRNTSRQREGEAAIPAEGACAAPAVGHPLVPGGKPQRAKQFFKSTVKLQGLGEKVTCKSPGFQEAGRKNVPIWLPLWKAWDTMSLHTTRDAEFHAKEKEVCLMGDRK